MSRSTMVLSLGVLSLVFGIAGLAQERGLSVLDKRTLANLMVGAGASESNKQCKAPEPDCPDERCKALGANQCVHKDDYSFAENNYCIQSSGSTCNLDDWSKCYDEVTCNKNPLKDCGASFWCTKWHNQCTTVTTSAWDDCSTS